MSKTKYREREGWEEYSHDTELKRKTKRTIKRKKKSEDERLILEELDEMWEYDDDDEDIL